MIPDAGLEIQLPADFRRQGRADAGRLGHHRQHHRRGLDQRAAGGGVGPAGIVHQQSCTSRNIVPRQTVELPEDRAANPVIYGGAVTEGANSERAMRRRPCGEPDAGVHDRRLGRRRRSFAPIGRAFDDGLSPSNVAMNVCAARRRASFSNTASRRPSR